MLAETSQTYRDWIDGCVMKLLLFHRNSWSTHPICDYVDGCNENCPPDVWEFWRQQQWVTRLELVRKSLDRWHAQHRVEYLPGDSWRCMSVLDTLART